MKKTAFIFVFVCIVLCVACSSKQTNLAILKNINQIDKIEISYGYKKVEKMIISDKSILQKVNTAFRSMIETNKFYGGYSDKSVTLFIYKGKEKVRLIVSHSPYYGWVLSSEQDNSNYDCPYIFNFVDSFYKEFIAVKP